jgi:hypothetical protein
MVLFVREALKHHLRVWEYALRRPLLCVQTFNKSSTVQAVNVDQFAFGTPLSITELKRVPGK